MQPFPHRGFRYVKFLVRIALFLLNITFDNDLVRQYLFLGTIYYTVKEVIIGQFWKQYVHLFSKVYLRCRPKCIETRYNLANSRAKKSGLFWDTGVYILKG